MSENFLVSIGIESQRETNLNWALKAPKKYKVILKNDDYTPMEFVVEVIKKFFYLGEEHAVGIMLKVHYEGRGVCGVFTKEIAETKVSLVNEYAKQHEHPLLCSMEAE